MTSDVKLTKAQMAVLRRLVQTGNMRAKEAALEGGTSRTLTGLATKGLSIRRHTKYGPLYYPTPAGRAQLRKAAPHDQ